MFEQFNTIFLDRDGVINRRLPDDYVKKWDEFEFLPGVLEAMKIFSGYFKHILVVTNQRGVGKDIMTEDDLMIIHNNMIYEINRHQGRIDKVYYCTDIYNDSPNRKPNSGMALQAKRDFPDIDFKKSIMIGDDISDMEFGKRLGMKTILISNFELNDGLLKFALSLTR